MSYYHEKLNVLDMILGSYGCSFLPFVTKIAYESVMDKERGRIPMLEIIPKHLKSNTDGIKLLRTLPKTLIFQFVLEKYYGVSNGSRINTATQSSLFGILSGGISGLLQYNKIQKLERVIKANKSDIKLSFSQIHFSIENYKGIHILKYMPMIVHSAALYGLIFGLDRLLIKRKDCDKTNTTLSKYLFHEVSLSFPLTLLVVFGANVITRPISIYYGEMMKHYENIVEKEKGLLKKSEGTIIREILSKSFQTNIISKALNIKYYRTNVLFTAITLSLYHLLSPLWRNKKLDIKERQFKEKLESLG